MYCCYISNKFYLTITNYTAITVATLIPLYFYVIGLLKLNVKGAVMTYWTAIILITLMISLIYLFKDLIHQRDKFLS